MFNDVKKTYSELILLQRNLLLIQDRYFSLLRQNMLDNSTFKIAKIFRWRRDMSAINFLTNFMALKLKNQTLFFLLTSYKKFLKTKLVFFNFVLQNIQLFESVIQPFFFKKKFEGIQVKKADFLFINTGTSSNFVMDFVLSYASFDTLRSIINSPVGIFSVHY